MMEREEKNRLILAELARLYPDAKPALYFANPFQLLVAVVLSAQCTDVKVNMVTPALFAAYPDAAALAKAEPEEIEPYIKTCGLFHNKAKNLVLMGAGAGRPLRRRSARGSRRSGIPAGRGTQDGERRHELRVRRGRHRRRYACFPRHQSAGAGGRAGCAQDRASAHAGRSQRSVEPRAPLADLPRPPRLRRAQTRVRNLHAARMVRLRERESQKQEIMTKARTSRLFSIREVRAFLIHEKLLKIIRVRKTLGFCRLRRKCRRPQAAYFFFRFITASTAAQRPSVAPQRSTGWRRPSAAGWTYPARAQPRSFRKPSVPRIPAL